MKMGGFAAARNAMMGLTEEYKAAAECDKRDFTFDINDEYELLHVDQEEEEPHYCFLEDEELEYLEEWLANVDNFKSLKSIAKKFEGGAKFVAICGDGNCFFSACSVNTTACKELPNGTDTKHNDFRQKACDMIITQSKDKESFLYKRMMARQTPLEGKALQNYIANKRKTTGALSSWSDSITFEAMAIALDRPVMQLTYPRYIDGVKRPELEPKFWLSSSGSREKLPMFIHYNGINHYNTFVPKAYPVSVKKPVVTQSKPTGQPAFAMGGMFAGLDDGTLCTQQKKPMQSKGGMGSPRGAVKPSAVKAPVKAPVKPMTKPAAKK